MKTKLLLLLVTISAIGIGCSNNNQREYTEEEAANIEIIKEYTQAMNEVDYETFKEIIDTSMVWHLRGRTLPNAPESERDVQAHWKNALPDMDYGIEVIFAHNDMVAVLYNYTGTHMDTLLGFPPTGNKISVDEMVINRLKNKRIVEQWVVFDFEHIKNQLSKQNGD
jgi:predicted ester cyclase